MSRSADQIDRWVETVIEARLGRADVATLLARPATVDVQALTSEAEALLVRREEARVDYFVEGQGTKREYEDTRDRIDRKLATIREQLAANGRSSAVSEILAADSPVAAWRATAGQVDRRGAILDLVMTVTLLPSPPGVRIFDERSVAIEWVTA